MIKTIEIIKRILEAFDKNNIKYCIMRNYEFILENKTYEGKDIDTIVLKKDMEKIDRILRKQGFGIVPMNPFSMHKGYAKYIKEDEKLLQFHFHIDGVTGRHVSYLDAEDILKRRVKKKFFYHSSKEDEFLIILLHNLLDLNKFKEKYKENATKLYKTIFKEQYVEKKLMKIFDQEQTDKILYLISQKNYDKLEKLMPKLKKHFETKNLLKIWFGVYLRGAVWKLPYLFKSSPLISFIGMDGAGKTTHTNRLKEILDNNKISYSVVYTGRGRNNILPIQFFGKPYKKIEEKAKKKNKKIKKSFNKKLIYTLAAPIFALDLWLRYFIRIWPKRKTKKIVITDRYLTDILLMANVPMFFKKFLYFFLPKPTKTIYLWNKAEILHKRKPDHSLEDLKRQEMLFSELNKKIKPLAIKSEKKEKTAEEVAEAVFAQIFE